jgi:predicted methyltransferase MtxX (methanogen marker protein 4)
MNSEKGREADPLAEGQEEQAQAMLKSEQVMEMLKEKGVDITHEQAIQVLVFLHQLSNIIVSKFLQNEQDS